MSAIAEFQKSVDFPNSKDLLKSLQKFGDQSHILLRNFKNRLSEVQKVVPNTNTTSNYLLSLVHF